MAKESNVTIGVMELKARSIQAILENRGYDCTVKAVKVTKNNIVLDGFTLWMDGKNIAPTYYDHGEDPDVIADILLNSMKEVLDSEIEKWFSREYLLSHVRPLLIGDNEINRKMIADNHLEYIPYCNLDLILIFALQLDTDDFSKAMIKLSRKHLEKANVKLFEVIESALDYLNTNASIISMSEMMFKMMGIGDYDTDFPTYPEDEMMYVLTTQDNYCGAAMMISERKLRQIAEDLKCQRFYILPSSIHEVILVPDRETFTGDPGYLLDMVKEVNSTEVKPEDKLSDSVFIFENGYVSKIA